MFLMNKMCIEKGIKAMVAGHEQRSKPAMVLFFWILLPGVTLVCMPLKYHYEPGSPISRYLPSEPEQREVLFGMSSRLAPYAAIYCLTGPGSSSFSSEKITDVHTAFENLLKTNRPRIWGGVQREVKNRSVHWEFSAYWAHKKDGSFRSAETRAGKILVALDSLNARYKCQPALRPEMEKMSQELVGIKSFEIFAEGDYRLRICGLKNIVYAWTWISI
jgi:hypothetical protein